MLTNSRSLIPKISVKTLIGFLLFFQAGVPDLKGQSYCTPPASICSDFRNFRIDSIAFSSIQNPSGCSVNGYSDYTTTVNSAAVKAGTYVPIYIKSGTSVYLTKNVTVAIDFNHDGNFDKDEITILKSANTSATGSVRIPFTSLIGNARMRIALGEEAGEMAMCNNTGYGETEDYLINILPPDAPGPNFTFYVNKSAGGTSDGLSWTNAFQTISEAMNIAQGRDTIKVAKGYYIQKATVDIKDSVVLKGGYPDSGNPSEKERDFGRNQTIITGDPGNSAILFEYLPIIFRAKGTASSNKKNFILDGFIIESAYQNAVYVQSVSSGEIRNCVFRKNNNFNEGAALNCINSQLIVSNCFFDNNNYAAAKTTIHSTQNSSIDFRNCIFSNNNGTNGVIYCNESTNSFTNCNFVNNDNYHKTILAENSSFITVQNSIFFNNLNVNGVDSSEIQLNSAMINISNSITQNYDYGNKNLFSIDPKFDDITNIAGPDNFYFTNDDGLKLINPCSPAINAGYNSIPGVEYDILGQQRIFGTQVDLGAYEVQSEIIARPTTLYVNALATGKNDGSSWENAFTDLQRALHFCSDTIQIAAGSYSPSETDQTVSFILENKRIILGGYPNTGNPTESQRNPSKYPTVLTGNLPNGKKAEIIIRGKNLNNSAIVDGVAIMNSGALYRNTGAVYLVANANAYFRNCTFKDNNLPGLVSNNSSPKIVNCTFENNQSSGNDGSGGASNFNNSRTHFINCLFKENVNSISSTGRSAGGAVLNFDSDAVFDSCTFLRNIVNNNGGAMANINSNPIINNCKFLSNIVYSDFGGYANDIYNDHSSPKISNSFFQGNTSCRNGGSIANINSSAPVFTKCEFKNGFATNYGGVCYNAQSNPQFINCAFTNSKAGKGGVFYNTNFSNPTIINCVATGNSSSDGDFMYNDKSNPTIINSTIVNNGGGVFVNDNNSKLTFYNSIMWNNNIDNVKAEITGTSTIPVDIRNSITQAFGKNGINENIVGINPRLVDITNPAGPDSLFFTPDDGINLCDCSPAINKGLNSAITDITTDIKGGSRTFDGTVDIGAYEFQSTAVSIPKTYYVNASAKGANDGSTWANAYNELKTAIQNSCSDTVKVAMGVYKPAIKSRDSSFYINRGITIIGGYPNTGNPGDAVRNTDTYPTVLSGDIGIAGDSTDNSYNIMKINCLDTTVNIQGLTFKFGSATALYASVNKHSVISNCRFYNNYSATGGAVYANKNVLIEKCVFSNNNGRWGGALYVSGENVAVKNSVFNNNFASFGAAVYCSSNAIFENTVFYKNTTNYTGAGVYIDGNQFAKFINCNFVKNNVIGTGTGTGTDLFFSYSGSMFSNPLIVNCIFKDNMVFGIKNENKHTDWAWVKSGNYASDYELNIQNSALKTFVNYYENNISSASVSFRNIEDAIGPDGLWFTDDDGLMPDGCSQTIDKGDNASVVNIPTDIMENSRIYNARVDIGAYEFNGSISPLLTITASDSVICSGTPVTFTAKPTSGGNNPFYQWFVNDVKTGSDSVAFISNTLQQGDKVKCILTSNSDCVTGKSAESNTVAISISSSITPQVSITSLRGNICKGEPITFKAIATNAGPHPSFQWQVNNINAGTDSAFFTATNLRDRDEVNVILTSGFTCASPTTATSNLVNVSVITPPEAHAGKDTTICLGTFANLNGSGGNYYQWTTAVYNVFNPNIAAPVANPQANAVYYLRVSNDGICFSQKDSVTVYVREPVNSSVRITAQTNSNCSGEPILFSATAVNGGNAPIYQWQVNGMDVPADGADFTNSTLKDGNYVRVILTSNILCANQSVSDEIVITTVEMERPVVVIENKKLIVTNYDNKAIYTLQILRGSQWADVTVFANEASAVITTEGMYRARAQKGNCSRLSNEIPSKQGINAPSGIGLYPNPTKGNITVDSLSSNWEAIEVYNLQGKRVLPPINVRNQPSVVIHLEHLTSGYYILRIVNKEGEKKQFKIIKE